jgi:cellulose synthase/poly-beta-1,6-N-acetylglucosamine synthase-like glycosyltransferase
MISYAAELAVTMLLGILVLPLLVLLLQAAAMFFLREPDPLYLGRRPSVAIIIPAHNEALVISHSVLSAKSQMSDGDRIIVVADNCSDETRDIAEQAGAEVVIRSDLTRVGKGYALEAAVRYLAETGPREVVVFLDADCVFGPGALGVLARTCADRVAPIQALYSMRSRGSGGSSARMAEFAWRIRTHLRPTGYFRLGLPCNLMGSGMAFPWNILNNAELGTDHLAEDLLLGLDLALQGSPAWFCPRANVTSEFPQSQRSRDHQKQRWIHGFLATVQSHLPKLAARSIQRRDICALALAADLLVPPLTILVLVCFAIFVAALLLFLLASWTTLFIVSALNLGLLCLFLLLAWQLCGRDIIGLREVVRFPSLLPFSIWSFVRFLARRRSAWVRTDRK